MMKMLNNSAIKQKSPLIVELVGLAGAGKTTLARALSQRDEKILVAADLELRKREHIPIFVGHVPFLLPVFLRRCRSSRWFTWDEIKAMVYLKGWPRVLRQESARSGKAILLDHGPVFKLATLNEFGPEKLRTEEYKLWWNDMFRQWASIMDIVIWLDAPDRVLEKRINSRDQRHLIKGETSSEVVHFLARYRTSYEEILVKLNAYREPLRLQFDTSRTPIEQVADEILSVINTRAPS